MNYNKDENVHRYALRGDKGKLLERERETERQRERLGYRDTFFQKKA